MMHYPLLNASHDAHHDKAGYYRLTFETLRGKMNQTDKQFLFPLLGNRDQEKILEIVAKVEKTNQRATRETFSQPRRAVAAPYPNVCCFYCNRSGRFRAHCPQRRFDMTTDPNSSAPNPRRFTPSNRQRK